MHKLRGSSCYRLHFLLLLLSAALIVSYTGEHDIGSLLFRILILYCSDWTDRRLLGRRRRRAGRQRRQESISFGDSGEPMALPSGVMDGFAPLWNLQGPSRVCS